EALLPRCSLGPPGSPSGRGIRATREGKPSGVNVRVVFLLTAQSRAAKASGRGEIRIKATHRRGLKENEAEGCCKLLALFLGHNAIVYQVQFVPNLGHCQQV